MEYKGISTKIKKYLGYEHSESARNQYYYRLIEIDAFVNTTYNMGVDEVLTKIELKKFYIKDNGVKIPVDQYDLMGNYLQYLKKKTKRNNRKLSASTVHDHITTARTFIETETEIAFKTMKYNNKVKLPQIIKGTKLPLPRETILQLINACVHPYQARLKMILLLLSASCCRIGESLLLRLSDLHLDGKPYFGTRPPYYAYIHFRGEITKTGKERITLLTPEIASQLKLWVDDKFRIKNKVIGTDDGKYRTEDHTPEINPNDFLFLNIDRNYDGKDAAIFIYNNLLKLFHELLDIVKLNQRSSNGQYAITPHKIRMGVRTAISSLVTDMWFPDFYMGHDTSTYYNPTPEQYKAQFKLCQSALIYLDQTEIIKTQGEISARMDNIEQDQISALNQRILQLEQTLSKVTELSNTHKIIAARDYNTENGRTLFAQRDNTFEFIYSEDKPKIKTDKKGKK